MPFADNNVAAFIDGVSAGDLVPVFFRRELHAEFAAVLFVAFGEENHVAVEPRSGTLQSDQDGEIRDGHALVVNRAAAIEIVVLDHRAKGVDGPLGFVDAHHIQVTHEQKRARRVGHGAGRKARDDESAPRNAFENLRMDSFLVEDAGDIFRGDEFVARRIYGIDADEVLQPIERVAFQLGKIVRLRAPRMPAASLVAVRPGPCVRPGATSRRSKQRRALTRFEQTPAPSFSAPNESQSASPAPDFHTIMAVWGGRVERKPGFLGCNVTIRTPALPGFALASSEVEHA